MDFSFNKIQFEHNRLFLLLSNKSFQKLSNPTVLNTSKSSRNIDGNRNNSESLDMDQELYFLLQMTPNILPLEFPLTETLQATIESCLRYRLSMGNFGNYQLLFCSDSDGGETGCGHLFKNGEPVYRCL